MVEARSIFIEKNITKALMKFSIPAIITILVSELYNMVDTFFVGRYVGANAIGALGIAFPIQRLMISLALLIGIGTATEVARAYGAKNLKRLNKSISNSFLLGIITFVIVPIAVFLFRKSIITVLGASTTIYPLAETYISIVLIGSILLGFTNIFGYTISSLGNPKVVLISTTIGAVANILINYALVAKLNMGVEGAAISTVVSQLLGFLYSLYCIMKAIKNYKLDIKLSFDIDIMKAIVFVGFSTFIVEISDAVVIGVLNNILLNIGGDSAIIMVGVITRVSMLMYITMLGISSGMQPLASYSYGAQEYDRLKEIVRKTIQIAVSTSVVLWIIMFTFAPQLIGTFLKEKELLHETTKAFRTTISIFPVITVYYVSIYYYQAINEAKRSFLLSIYRQLVLFIPIVMLLGKNYGLFGAWITYPITDVISAITGYIYIKKGLEFLEEENFIAEKIYN